MPSTSPDDPLEQILLGLSESDPFTIRDACEGVQIFGSSGSGKTSGSGRLLAQSYLRAGLGGLVLTAKAEETELWRKYAEETGRSDDLLIINPQSPYRFNFLEQELAHAGHGAGQTENVLQLFLTLAEVSRRSKAKSTSDNDAYWRDELQKLVGNAIDILRFADEPVTLQNVHQIIRDAPQKLEDVENDSFGETSFCIATAKKATARQEAGLLPAIDEGDFDDVVAYWSEEFPAMHARHRTSAVGNFTGLSRRFLRGVLRELFCTSTNFGPQDCFDGKIIVLDMPLKTFNETGIFAQVLFKFCWQRAVERRRVDFNSRPVFLWADESQFFVNEYDCQFQTTARGFRVATVFLTQNLPNYHYYLGADRSAEALTDALLGNLSTKIFHHNTCVATNKYASELFGRDWRGKNSSSANYADGKVSHGIGHHDELLNSVEPREFTTLAKGGPKNEFIVEGIVHQGGRIFNASGMNALLTLFRQSN